MMLPLIQPSPPAAHAPLRVAGGGLHPELEREVAADVDRPRRRVERDLHAVDVAAAVAVEAQRRAARRHRRRQDGERDAAGAGAVDHGPQPASLPPIQVAPAGHARTIPLYTRRLAVRPPPAAPARTCPGVTPRPVAAAMPCTAGRSTRTASHPAPAPSRTARCRAAARCSWVGAISVGATADAAAHRERRRPARPPGSASPGLAMTSDRVPAALGLEQRAVEVLRRVDVERRPLARLVLHVDAVQRSLPSSPGMRLQVNSTDGPFTTEPSSGEPTCGAAGFGPAGLTRAALLNGPQPSPLQAATITDACPAGTGSVTLVAPTTWRAATVSAPPPGPAGGG